MKNVYGGILKNWCHIVTLLFLVAVLIWTFVKIDRPAYHDPNGGDVLSFTPFNDYLILMGGTHFADEGYIDNYFLANMTVGYPEFARGWYAYQTPLTDVRNASIYYTHYGSIDAMVLGVLLKLGITGLTTMYKIMTILSLIALALWYILAYRLFGRGIALISVVVAGSSLVFLRFIDNVSVYTYDILFAFGAALLFTWVETKSELDRWKRNLAYAGVFILAFLLMYNSPEFVPWLILFFIGYLWVKHGKQIIKRWKMIVLLVAVPVAAQVVHFFQVAIALGGLGNAFTDFASALTRRTTGFALAEEVGFRSYSVPEAILKINGDLWTILRFEFILLVAMLAFTWWLTDRLRKLVPEDDGDRLYKQWKLLLVFFVAGVAFWFILIQSTVTNAGSVYRTILPFLGLAVGYSIVNIVRYFRIKDERPWVKVTTMVILVAILAPTLTDRLSLRPFHFEEHQQRPDMYYGIDPEEIKMLGSFIQEETAFGDIVVTDFRVAETGHPRYPFPGYEYHSQRRIEVARDADQAIAALNELEQVRDSLPANNPASGVRFYLLFDEGSYGSDFHRLAEDIGSLKAVFYADDYWTELYGTVPYPAGSSLPFAPRVFWLYSVDLNKLADYHPEGEGI